ncbi:tetratricopeptide repeat protein [Marimonas arenosa]|uniref:Sel1 repeat family protein n=1 Tax=Marimonas arenosa TaxID=1795305 RepID=A0AAE3WCN7_9RHOB|nr:tetratricopeptide repeat protein [Marimonas arenosa]MDQ2090279.1 sel1 repeat family protein [Marimonas arenosa]
MKARSTSFSKPGVMRLAPAIAVLVIGLSAAPVMAQQTMVEPEAIAAADAAIWAKPGPAMLGEAQAVLEKAAADGDSAAQRILAQHLLYGWVLEKNVDKGLVLLKQAAAGGDGEAQAELGQSYLWGTWTETDVARGRDLLEQAAAQKDPEAMRMLGEQLVGGWRLGRDIDRGQALLQAAIEAGNDKANVALGKLLLYGQGVRRDRARALELFEAAAVAGNGAGLAIYGEDLMWREADATRAEAMLVRAGELGAGEAWSALAHGAMYGYLGGGRKSRAKYAGYVEKARAAGEQQVAVLEANRSMWGINMRASGPRTIEGLTLAADRGNAEAAKFLIELLRDGNDLNLRRRPIEAQAALESYTKLLSDKERAQYALTLAAAKARTPAAYAPVAESFDAQPELHSKWFGMEIMKANPNVAFYILQKRLKAEGLYRGPLNGYATRATLRAVYKACRTLEKPQVCNDSVMRRDVIGALLARD